MTKRKLDDLERVEVESLTDLRHWLRQNHTQTESVWLVRFKKHHPDKYFAFGEVVDEILCWGWVDSAVRKLDDDRTMHLISPRKPTSAWSAVNKDKVARMTAEGRMQPSGQAMIDIAKSNGMWDFLNDVDALIEPDDLRVALDAVSKARAGWDAFNASSQRGILEWIKQARRAETRAKRISETARLAARGIRANHPEARGM